MACNTSLSAIIKSCDNNVGGLIKFYIAPTEFVTGVTATTGTVTSIAMSGASKFVEFEFNKNSASYTDEAAISLENGSTYYTETITLKLPRREVAKRNAIALIAAGQRPLKIIVKDQNGLYWYAGYQNSVNLSALAGGSGAAKADGSSYDLTFLGEEPSQMYEVLEAAVALVI